MYKYTCQKETLFTTMWTAELKSDRQVKQKNRVQGVKKSGKHSLKEGISKTFE